MSTEALTTSENGSLKKAIVAGVCATAICLGGVFAYLTATDVAHNKFQPATSIQDKIYIVEPTWDGADDSDGDGVPDFAEDVTPGQVITKDPQVYNESPNDAYVIVQTTVPTYSWDGEAHELFEYTVNSGWTEQGDAVYDAENHVTVHTYFMDGTLAKGTADEPTKSSQLFDEVTIAAYPDGMDEVFQGEGGIEQLDVSSVAISTTGFNSISAAWTAYQADNASAAGTQS